MIFVLVGYVCVCALRRSMCEIFMQVKFEFTAVAIKGFYFTERCSLFIVKRNSAMHLPVKPKQMEERIRHPTKV